MFLERVAERPLDSVKLSLFSTGGQLEGRSGPKSETSLEQLQKAPSLYWPTSRANSMMG